MGYLCYDYFVIQRQLHKLLKKRGKSIYWLAKETGVSEQALSRFMKGKTTGIEFETLNRICEALDCKPGDLLVYVANDETNDARA